VTASFFAPVPLDEATSAFLAQVIADLEALEQRVLASESLVDEDAAAVAQLKADVEALIATIPEAGTSVWKTPVRVATAAPTDVSSAPSVIDGVTLAIGDRILLLDQPSTANSGIWEFAGADTPLTRPTDADSTAKRSPGIFVLSLEGDNNARVLYRADGAPDALTFTPFTGGSSATPSGPRFFDIAAYFSGEPPVASTIFSYAPSRPLSIPAAFSGSTVSAVTAPASLVSFEFRVAGNKVGSLVLEAGGSAYFLSDTPATAIDVAAGDTIAIVTPANVQGTEDIAFTLATTVVE